jgi:hypothetical protein
MFLYRELAGEEKERYSWSTDNAWYEVAISGVDEVSTDVTGPEDPWVGEPPQKYRMCCMYFRTEFRPSDVRDLEVTSLEIIMGSPTVGSPGRGATGQIYHSNVQRILKYRSRLWVNINILTLVFLFLNVPYFLPLLFFMLSLIFFFFHNMWQQNIEQWAAIFVVYPLQSNSCVHNMNPWISLKQGNSCVVECLLWPGKRSSLIEVDLFYVSTESVSRLRKQCLSLVAKVVLIGFYICLC